jgi:hypothetical protein
LITRTCLGATRPRHPLSTSTKVTLRSYIITDDAEPWLARLVATATR